MVPRASSRRSLLSVDDLSLDEITAILDAARDYESREVSAIEPTSLIVGLLFLESSLRTRVGYAVAARRLGGLAIDVHELRSGAAMSASESFEDTLRTLTGMVDAAVVRTPFPVHQELVAKAAVAPYINAGDGGDEHPTQALIDLFAIEEEAGPVAELRVALCGDLTMRAARSLLKLLNRMPPKSLTLISPEGRASSVDLAPELAARTRVTADADFEDVDLLYVVGLPAGEGERRLTVEARARFALTADRMSSLPRDGIVLSPLPVIDEIAPEVRGDQRIRMFTQSDRGVHVRMAVLRWATDADASDSRAG